MVLLKVNLCLFYHRFVLDLCGSSLIPPPIWYWCFISVQRYANRVSETFYVYGLCITMIIGLCRVVYKVTIIIRLCHIFLFNSMHISMSNNIFSYCMHSHARAGLAWNTRKVKVILIDKMNNYYVYNHVFAVHYIAQKIKYYLF